MMAVRKQDIGSRKETQQKHQPPSTEIGNEHALLKRTCGKFKAECTFNYEGKESVYEGEAEREMILGGRFLLEKFHGNFGGKEFEGQMLLGCTDGEFTSVWTDNMSNQIYVSRGRFNEGSSSEFDVWSQDPFNDDMTGRPKKTHQRNAVLSDDEVLFESYDKYMDTDEPEQRTMKIVYRRADQQQALPQ